MKSRCNRDVAISVYLESPPVEKGFSLKGIKGDFILKICIIPHNLPLEKGEAGKARIASFRSQ